MCEDVTLSDVRIDGGEQAAIVIKGGSRRIHLRRFLYRSVSPAAWCDVLIGDWSDQSTDKSTGIILEDHVREDGKRVRVVVSRGGWPIITGGNVRIC